MNNHPLKNLFKNIIVSILGWQVRRLRRQDFKIIGVVGSYGKTSTKYSLAELLAKSCRVCYQQGNYNDLVSVPLIFFNERLPSLYNPLQWLMLFLRNEKVLHKVYPYDVVVVELGVDGPNQMCQFERYLKLDYVVLSSIGYEHMEHFADLDEVANEELAVLGFSRYLIYNADLCPAKYLSNYQNQKLSYGFKSSADYLITFEDLQDYKRPFEISKNSQILIKSQTSLIAKFQLYSIAATLIIFDLLNLNFKDLEENIDQLQAMAGRMQLLAGIKQSLIIDDSYNSSPDALMAALDVLYSIKNSNRIAILGSMNELGDYSIQAHQQLGRYCQATKLKLVITIGKEANQYLAPEASRQGCHVQSFQSPFLAGKYLAKHIKSNSLVLVKGSQNGVFAEEAIKPILANSQDQKKLVRQSDYWLHKKVIEFSGL